MTDMVVMMSSGCCMHANVGYMQCIISGLSFRGGCSTGPRGGPGRLQLAASPQGRCFKGRGGDTLIARHAFENNRLF